mmetsp:Transcript_24848/g.44215  ORF Transcript_24848/g.44215 Transcript_24848/m.44215 type:complete len:206 (-) Transcript_24848:1294-1911(-)
MNLREMTSYYVMVHAGARIISNVSILQFSKFHQMTKSGFVICAPRSTNVLKTLTQHLVRTIIQSTDFGMKKRLNPKKQKKRATTVTCMENLSLKMKKMMRVILLRSLQKTTTTLTITGGLKLSMEGTQATKKTGAPPVAAKENRNLPPNQRLKTKGPLRSREDTAIKRIGFLTASGRSCGQVRFVCEMRLRLMPEWMIFSPKTIS